MAWKPRKTVLFSLPYVEANEYAVLRARLAESAYPCSYQTGQFQSIQ